RLAEPDRRRRVSWRHLGRSGLPVRWRRQLALAGGSVGMALLVEVIADVICPWCFIGKRRLGEAVAAGDGPVRGRWAPFEPHPAPPKEGVSRREYRTRKLGSWARSQQLDARVVAVGQAEGLPFAFDRIERTPNPLDAHRLLGLAGRQGVPQA